MPTRQMKMLGWTPTKVERKERSLDMYFTNGKAARIKHQQECCEEVRLEEVIGDLDDLLNHPLLIAEIRTSKENRPHDFKEYIDNSSFTWTFIELGTIKGTVTLRWFGSSNGYYSEEAEASYHNDGDLGDYASYGDYTDS